MNQPAFDFDICARKHGGSETSVAANKRVDKNKDRAAVLAIIRERGSSWSKQIARLMGKEIHQISGRISELKKNKVIEETDARIEGCAVLRVRA